MSEDVERYEIEENLYVVDSSGPAPEGERMKAMADEIAKSVEENFDPSRIRESGSAEDSD